MSSQNPAAYFDKEQAASYDERFAKLAPIPNALHLLMGGILSELPAEARVLCVGVGTGAELLALAKRFPGWRFIAVEPSAPMLEICRRRAAEESIEERCVFHEGYLDSLPPSEKFHAATSVLVSQFLVEPEARLDFFRGIGERLLPGGYLVSADLSAELGSPHGELLLDGWFRLLATTGLQQEQIENMRKAYQRDVAVIPPDEVAMLLRSAGFDSPVLFFQALLIHAWFAKLPGV
jgi:tRNA (cmo5U34)-methyltransferase